MHKFFRYDAARNASLAALSIFALTHFWLFSAWIATAPLVSLLRHVIRETVPALWPAALLLIVVAGAGSVDGI